MSVKERRPTTQPIGWVRDMSKAKLLNLSPRFQRRSVWNREFQQYFVDSIFKNYPVPPLFVNLEVTTDGTTIYHVIDGKQRLTAILEFLAILFLYLINRSVLLTLRANTSVSWIRPGSVLSLAIFFPLNSSLRLRMRR